MSPQNQAGEYSEQTDVTHKIYEDWQSVKKQKIEIFQARNIRWFDENIKLLKIGLTNDKSSFIKSFEIIFHQPSHQRNKKSEIFKEKSNKINSKGFAGNCNQSAALAFKAS